MNKKIAIIYHKDCSDGFSGAWVAWRKFKNRAEYYPTETHDKYPNIENKEKVYLIDFTHDKPVLEKICKNNKEVIIIDHHKSAKEKIKIADENFFNENNSGSILAWKYFFPNKKIPKILKYVEDVDLWNWKLKNIKEISSVIELTKHDFNTWSKLAKKLENKETRKQIIKEGKIILDAKNKYIERILKKRYLAKMDKHKISVVNSATFKSEIGHQLLKKDKTKISLIWSDSKEGLRVSLRSKDGIDVSKIAQKYGGGGHKNSAGFLVKPNTKIPWNKL